MINIELLETLRQGRGYSQEYIATMLGYDSSSAYNRKIRGKRSFTIEDIVMLCNIFQLEPNDLIIR